MQARENHPIVDICRAYGSREIDLEQLENYLKDGIDPNTTAHIDLFPSNSNNKNFAFPLLHIISKKDNSVEAAKLLIKYGADITKCDDCIGNTALLTAIALHDSQLAKFFIDYIKQSDKPEHKKILDQKDAGSECGNPPLVLALKKDEPKMDEVAKHLIQAGANVNIQAREGNTALHWACMLRKNEIINELLLSKADINITNKYGHTPGEYYNYQLRLIDFAPPLAVTQHLPSLATNLLEFSDYAHQQDTRLSPHHRYHIFTLMVKERNGHFDPNLSKKLISMNKPAKSLDDRHLEIKHSQYEKLQEQKSKMASKWMFFAFDNDMQYYINFLDGVVEEEKEEKLSKRFGNAQLSRAVFEKDEEKLYSLLKDKKFDITLKDAEGFTALHWAAMRRDEATIKLLIANGASSSVKNNYGRTPLDYYQYQITQFKHNEMPEFELIYQNPSWREIRNKRPINLELFGVNDNRKTITPELDLNQVNQHHPIDITTKQSSEFFKPSPITSNVVPTDLQKALKDGGVEEYIKKGHAKLEQLIELQKTKPWVIDALRCYNIRQGIYKKYIDIEELGKLSEEQINSIEHKFNDIELKSKVESFINLNQKQM